MSIMFDRFYRDVTPRALQDTSKSEDSEFATTGFAPMGSLHSLRDYRLRKIATKRIPSRVP